jgi:hypothetical protein
MARNAIIWILIAAGALLVVAGLRPMLRGESPDFVLLMVGIYFLVRGALARKRTARKSEGGDKPAA